MERTALNPWEGSIKLGYNQAEAIEDATRAVICAGQTALALDNLEALLKNTGMDLSNVIKLSLYATDVDDALKNLDLLGVRFGPHGVAPPMTLLGVTRLAVPGLLFEIEATAAE
ncbi:endoribonuclease L-PSP [Ruegeria sp. ANG-R]|uniref:RidA family protein n=1 Tax=Ruegeria sp. ANG-R TaxID=1577903 RepID=UPI00057C5D3A|nr:Rid family hydrolase [Ruegeria sp. ANG-R]KIC38592.1 endoribonuclease L-PSP [Ruegeria sp. ANG-R]